MTEAPTKTESPPGSAARYLRWLAGTLALLTAAVLVLIGAFQERLPPPPFTGSISFDEKAV